jgi:hypothetical protein
VFFIPLPQRAKPFLPAPNKFTICETSSPKLNLTQYPLLKNKFAGSPLQNIQRIKKNQNLSIQKQVEGAKD